jgi:hypothetical protein
MPDEISHLVWTYLLLKHPKLREKLRIKTRKETIITYLSSILPDLGNLLMAVLLLNFTAAHNIPRSSLHPLAPQAKN